MKHRPPKHNRKRRELKKVGLARALSKLGYCSRSQAAELIRAGRVKLNGALRRDPETPAHPGKDRIEVDETPPGASAKIYLMLNKPLGVLRDGIRMNDGDFLRVKYCSLLRQGERNSWLEIVLDEGKNRHIRRLLENLNIEVLQLVRVAIGPLALGSLQKGAARLLTSDEKEAIDRAMR